jgi:hypothetical protein
MFSIAETDSQWPIEAGEGEEGEDTAQVDGDDLLDLLEQAFADLREEETGGEEIEEKGGEEIEEKGGEEVQEAAEGEVVAQVVEDDLLGLLDQAFADLAEEEVTVEEASGQEVVEERAEAEKTPELEEERVEAEKTPQPVAGVDKTPTEPLTPSLPGRSGRGGSGSSYRAWNTVERGEIRQTDTLLERQKRDHAEMAEGDDWKLTGPERKRRKKAEKMRAWRASKSK